MGHHHHVLAEGERPFPLFPLLGAGGLVIISLLSVAWLQWFAEPAVPASASHGVIAERSLSFEDTPDGAVVVTDAGTGATVARFEAGEQGFIRSTLRGLARARKVRGSGPGVPFRLEHLASGQLLLVDPVTDQTIDLWAFGRSNAQVFLRFLDDPSSPDRVAVSGAPTVAENTTRSNEP